MLDMGLPPYDADAALRMGDNSRAAEIQEVARKLSEVQVKYLKDNIREGTSNRVKILYAASISSMSDAAFRQLFVSLSFANRECNNLSPGTKRVAMLLERTERSVTRVAKELEDAGWLTKPKRQGRAPSVRSAAIPEKNLNAIIFEIFAKTDLSCRTENPVVPDLSCRTSAKTDLSPQVNLSPGQIASPARTNLSTEPYKEPYVVLEVPARESANALVEEDYVEFHKLFRSWGRKPGQFFESMGGITREFSDSQFDGALRALTKFPPEIRVEAARMTILNMQARNVFDDSRAGPRGFANYFQQELRGQASLLLDRQNNPPVQACAGPPGQQHWRDRKEAYSDSIGAAIKDVVAKVRREQS